jgi:SAM-dependent methyltransferase
MSPASILEAYVKTAPCPQNAIDIFKGEWASCLPAPYRELKAGCNLLFEDPRVAWALEQLGGCQDQVVLELGPLEGGHSYLLEQAGAASVLAIEANTRAYLKCLIVKEILGLRRVRFLCGDFTAFLETVQQTFDLIFASGVLYHMRDPVGLLVKLARHTDRIYLWTHYYDADVISGLPHLKAKFTAHEEAEVQGFKYTLHRHEYGEDLHNKNFYGGSAGFSNWLERQDIVGALRHFGFSEISTSNLEEEKNHSHGPCFSVAAERSA